MVAKTSGKAKSILINNNDAYWVGFQATEVDRKEDGYEYFSIEIASIDIKDIGTDVVYFEVKWIDCRTGEKFKSPSYTVGGTFWIEWQEE